MKRILTTVVLAMAFVSVGCAGGGAQTLLDETWGSSFADYHAGMIADPNAGSTDPILGVDPLTGEIIIETYLTEERNQKPLSKSIFLVTD